MAAMTGSAEISACGRYRYALRRFWDGRLFRGAHAREHVLWVMLNPSTADATEDDPTIRRCVGLSRAWGYGGLVVVNLYAWRATDPRELSTDADPVGPANGRYMLDEARGAALIVAAWGKPFRSWMQARAASVRALLQHPPIEATLYHVGLTKEGHPRHPLYVRGDVMPQVWS